jgi:hypothetical protein
MCISPVTGSNWLRFLTSPIGFEQKKDDTLRDRPESCTGSGGPPRHRSADGGLRKYLTRQGRGEARTGALRWRIGSWRARTATCPRTRGARRRRRRRRLAKGRARRRTRQQRRAGRPHRARPTVPPRPHEGERIASAAAAIAGGSSGRGIGGSLFASSSSLSFFLFFPLGFFFRRPVASLGCRAGCRGSLVMVCRWPTTETETGWAAVEVEQTCIASGGFVFRFRFRYRLLLVVLSVHERNRFLLWTIAMDELAGRVLNC